MGTSSKSKIRAFVAILLLVVEGCAAGTPTTSSDNGQSSTASADAGGSDSQSSDARAPEIAPTVKWMVFVSKVPDFYGTKSGGTRGADAKCQSNASAAGLPGRFRAWISTETVDAIDRVPEGGPWHNVKSGGPLGELVFESRDAWKDRPRADIETEDGNPNEEYFWTGTLEGGVRGKTCDSWSSSSQGKVGTVGTGAAYYSDARYTWTASWDEGMCEGRAALLCYQYE